MYQGFESEIPTICSCGEPLPQSRTFIIPVTGFIASPEVSSPGEEPPQHTYASSVYFGDYEQKKSEKYGENTEFVLDDYLTYLLYPLFQVWLYDHGYKVTTMDLTSARNVDMEK